MIRKSFHEYLETTQNPDNLVYIYGQQHKEILNKLQTQEAADLLIKEAAFSIVKEVQKALKF